MLLAADIPAHLATLDNSGFPHVTPLWFLWTDGAFHLTSFSDRPHVRRLAHNPRAGICVDFEGPLRADGERPNRQLRAVGNAELVTDQDTTWTRRIQRKYVGSERVALPGDQPAQRVLIRLRPLRVVAVASV